jgi:hypothetical protein
MAVQLIPLCKRLIGVRSELTLVNLINIESVIIKSFVTALFIVRVYMFNR